MREAAEQGEPLSERQLSSGRLRLLSEKQGGGNMKGSIQFLTGKGVAEGCERTAAAVRNLVMEDPALADISFEDEMKKARKAFKDAGAIRITARMVTRRLRASKMGAALGACRWRNSHLAKLADAQKEVWDGSRSGSS